MIGEKLGSYRIEERLGEGGMGVVYRAHDERLDRNVAVKVVSDRLAADPSARDKLLAEARTASGLNHPNICTIHEVDEIDGQVFVVMEQIEGSPLGGIVPEGGLAEEQVLRYGIQIADALDHAHDHGIVHRDLKSSNVIVTPEGRAKILDFGLARRLPPRVLDGLSQSRTQAAVIKEIGGTLQYMAPETLEAQTVDHRGDLWSLGVLLYEIATCSFPFRGRTEFEVASAILRERPAPMPARISPALRTIILHCLEKSPGQRYQHAGEVRAALEALHSDGTAGAPTGLAPQNVRTRWWPTLPIALVAVIIVAVLWLRHRDGPTDIPLGEGRLTLLMAPEGRIEDPVLSPDGTILAYVARSQGQVDLFVRRVRGERPIQLTDDAHTEGSPAFSPDGESIVFGRRPHRSQTSEIWIIPVFGGESRRVMASAAQPAWSFDGQSLAFIHRTGSGEVVLATASSSGEGVRPLLAATVDLPFLYAPAWSPAGNEIAVVRSSGGSSRQIWIVPVNGGEARPLHDDPLTVYSKHPVFTPDGLAVVHSSNRGGAENLWRTALDGSAPQRLTSGPGPDNSPSISATGAVAFLNSRTRAQLGLLDLVTGNTRIILTHSRFLWAPVFSPDGRYLSYSRSEIDGSWSVWLCNTDGAEARQVTPEQVPCLHSRFTPDGESLVYYSWTPEPDRIWRVPTGGGAITALTPLRENDDLHPDVSPDNRRLAFTRTEETGRFICIAPLAGGPARKITPGEMPHWSPDGQWITFAADRGYVRGVFVVRPDGSERQQLTETGGWPDWWPDGSRISYLKVGADGNQQVWTVPAAGGDPSRIDGLEFEGYNYPIDISPDGHSLVYTNDAHVSDEIWLLE